MANRRLVKAYIISVVACLALSGISAAATPGPTGYKPDEVLVKFKPGVAASAIARAYGVKPLRTIHKIGVHCFQLPSGMSVESAVCRLKKNSNVVYVTPNHVIRAAYMPDDEWFEWFQWGLYNPPDRHDVHAPEAWDLQTGSESTVIAIVDSGIDASHPDLEGKVISGYNAIDGSSNTDDDHMHGTFVAALAGAWTDNAEGIAGMDWQARLMPVKVISGLGYGDEFDAADGTVWAAGHGAKIINMSFGAYADGANEEGLLALEDAVNYAWAQGCLVVCASGNDSLDDAVERHYPSYYPAAISVGGTDDTDSRWIEIDLFTGEVSGGSNYGDSLDVMAPASLILSAVPLWYYYETGTLLGVPYEFASGTSAAAPVVSGLAGLIWASHPGWTNQQVRDQIEGTCDDLISTGWDRYTGWGRINAYRALNEAFEVYPTVSSLSDLELGSLVKLAAKPVSAGTADLSDRFYIEEEDRSAGIMVYYGSNVTTPTSEGNLAEVTGRLSMVDGQLAIVDPRVSIAGSTTPVKPLGMLNRSVGGRLTAYAGVTGGKGLTNTGLLIKAWGKVTAVGWNYFYIDDGCASQDGSGFTGLKIYGTLSLTDAGRFVAVTGVSACEIPPGTQIRVPVVRTRRSSDILKLN